MVTVGRIARPHGNRGQVIVEPETDFPRRAVSRRARRCSRCADGTRSSADASRSSREHDGRWVVGFDGVETMNEAEALAGVELRMPADGAAAAAGRARTTCTTWSAARS